MLASVRPLLPLAGITRLANITGLDRIGIPVVYAKDQAGATGPVVVTNYERLDRFEYSALAGVVLDESSILKAYSGTTKRALLAAFEQTPYKLACTATPAPNDHLELGNHAEFLGVMSSHQMDVLGLKAAQARGINDPDAPLVTEETADPDRVKRLAEDFLRQRGESTKEAA